MRTIERSTAFKRDYNREARGKYRDTLDNDLQSVLVALVFAGNKDVIMGNKVWTWAIKIYHE